MNVKSIIWKVVLIAALLIGIVGAYYQFTVGHVLTGISKQVPWGMYIAAFTFFIGISTGSTIIGFMIHTFNVEKLKPFESKAVIISVVSLAGAILFLMVDVGSPFKMLAVPLIWRNISSVFFYSSISYMLFGFLIVYQLVLLMKRDKGNANDNDNNKIKWLAIISLPLALGIVLVPDGALFSFVKAREFWSNPLLLPHFANAALASGVSVIIFTAAISYYTQKKMVLKEESLNILGLLLTFMVAGLLFLDLFNILVLTNSSSLAGNETWHLLTGNHLIHFLVSIFGLVIALLILLFKDRNKIGSLFTASVLVIIAISSFRYNLVIVGQEIPLINGEEIGNYIMSLTEFSIAAGITAFCLLVYQALIKKYDTQTVTLKKTL